MKAIFSPLAEKQLKKLPKITQILIAKKVRQIRDQNIITGVKIVAGCKGIHRVQIGDYRLVFRKYSDKIYFVSVGHRKEIYKLLARI